MSIASIIANLPALVVVIPLLLAPIAALIPISGAAWLVAVIGSGGALVSAFLLQGAVSNGSSFSYHLGSWPPPWGIEFVVDSASALTVLIMAALAYSSWLRWRSWRHCLPARRCQQKSTKKTLAKPIQPGFWLAGGWPDW